MMPKLVPATVPATNQSGFPPQYTDVLQGRWYRRLAKAGGLTDFGVTHVSLEPGAWSSQRHWHENNDEFVVMLEGHATLVDNDGEHPMTPGDCAAFPKNDGNGHCLVNRSDAPCSFIVVGPTVPWPVHFPDIDVHHFADGKKRRKDGSEFDAVNIP
jgi:uncharacterized cupin superfamily protein